MKNMGADHLPIMRPNLFVAISHTEYSEAFPSVGLFSAL